jgi:hypothetical protein
LSRRRVRIRADGRAHIVAAELADARADISRRKYELGEALRLDTALQAARLTLARLYLSQNEGDSAGAVLDLAPRQQQSSYQLLLQKGWILLAKGDWDDAATHIGRLAEFERTPELLEQVALLRSASRRLSAGSRASIELVRMPARGSANAEPLINDQTEAQVRSVAMKHGAEPRWESYRSDLLVLPRGLLRSVLDPDGLLELNSFGRWQPMIRPE